MIESTSVFLSNNYNTKYDDDDGGDVLVENNKINVSVARSEAYMGSWSFLHLILRRDIS